MKKRKPRLIDLDWSKEVGNTAIGQDREMRGKQVQVKGREGQSVPERVQRVVPGVRPTRSRVGWISDSGVIGRKPSRLGQGLRSHEHEDGG